MLSILLINENKIVSRLLQLIAQKNSYNIDERKSLDNLDGYYDVVFIDSDLYKDGILSEINKKLKYGKLGYIGVKQGVVPDGFDLFVEKPFLPTDFVNLLKNEVITKVSKPTKVEKVESDDNSLTLDDEADLLMDNDVLDLDEIDDVDDLLTKDHQTKDENVDLGDLDDLDSLDLDDDFDLSLDPSKVMTTGIASNMVNSEDEVKNLSNMVDEIEDMPNTFDKELGAAVAATAVGTVASNVVKNGLKETKEESSKLGDIENLDENELKHVLGEEPKEEIISEEIVSDGVETMVESNEVEKWIKDAVAKAITPQMIQEALSDMNISVNLTFEKK